MRRFGLAALDLVYPERCAGCGRFAALLCTACEVRLTPARGPGRCSYCSGAWTREDNCPRCFHWRSLDGCLAAYEMSGPARALVHLAKYGRVRAAAALMAERVAGLREAAAVDFAVAAPLHPRRMRERGFNQAAVMLDAAGWPALDGLLKLRNTRAQAGLRLQERARNVRDAFRYDGPPLDGLSVAVVDDVVTSGATADDCARALKEQGARRVVAVSFARTSYEGEPAPGS
jgi:predicted amidophosphoribosyltransferase